MGKKKIEIERTSWQFYEYDEDTRTLELKEYHGLFYSVRTLERIQVGSLHDALAYIRSKGEKIKSITDL